MPQPRALICPPTGPGSLGDEAMITALASRLVAQGFVVDAMPPFDGVGRWDHLPEVDSHVPYPQGGPLGTPTRLLRLMRRYDRLYVLGADVLDGHYEDRTLRRLLLAAAIGRLAGRPTTIVGFSYNGTPSAQSRRLLRLLPPGVRILVRDPASLSRFRKVTRRPAELSADVAFLLEPAADLSVKAAALEAWIARMRELDRTVVAFNAGGASYVPDRGQPDLERIAWTYAAELGSLLRHHPDVAVAVIAHDHRAAVEEHALLRAVLDRIDVDVRDRVSGLVSQAVGAREVKRLMAAVDLVCTSRMHLAVAALGSGTPAISIAYQDKFAGLYEHFSLEPLQLTHAESLVTGQLEAFLTDALGQVSALAEATRSALPRVRALAERNLGLAATQEPSPASR